MKKEINNLTELLSEKARVIQHQKELENKISSTWSELKENLKPENLIVDSIQTFVNSKSEDHQKTNDVANSFFKFGLTTLTNWITLKVSEKLLHLFKKKSTKRPEDTNE